MEFGDDLPQEAADFTVELPILHISILSKSKSNKRACSSGYLGEGCADENQHLSTLEWALRMGFGIGLPDSGI